MDKVLVHLRNLQSHEDTAFTLEPGLNFILAHENNAGKSAIFRVLTAIAKAPKNSPGNLERLIRLGHREATASFSWEGQRVIAYIQRDVAASTKMFFEHIFDDGETIRSTQCPEALCKALGFMFDGEGNLINFNDADSVQLVAKCSVEADSIIAHVMLDSRVETIKENMRVLSRELQQDSRFLLKEKAHHEQMLQGTEYNLVADDFLESEEFLVAASRIADSQLQEIRNMPDSTDINSFSRLGKFIDILTDLDPSLQKLECKAAELPVSPEVIDTSMRLISDMASADVRILSRPLPSGVGLDVIRRSCAIAETLSDISETLPALEKRLPSEDQLAEIKSGQNIANTLASLGPLLYRLSKSSDEIKDMALVRQQIYNTMQAQGQDVMCPVKGRVLYTDEKCLSYFN